jgi:hypothetical protein
MNHCRSSPNPSLLSSFPSASPAEVSAKADVQKLAQIGVNSCHSCLVPWFPVDGTAAIGFQFPFSRHFS